MTEEMNITNGDTSSGLEKNMNLTLAGLPILARNLFLEMLSRW